MATLSGYSDTSRRSLICCQAVCIGQHVLGVQNTGGSRKTDRVVCIWCAKHSENFILLINYYQSLVLACSRVYNEERAILQGCVLTKSTNLLIKLILIIIINNKSGIL